MPTLRQPFDQLPAAAGHAVAPAILSAVLRWAHLHNSSEGDENKRQASEDLRIALEEQGLKFDPQRESSYAAHALLCAQLLEHKALTGQRGVEVSLSLVQALLDWFFLPIGEGYSGGPSAEEVQKNLFNSVLAWSQATASLAIWRGAANPRDR